MLVRSRYDSNQGFTLTESVIVVATIGVLAAISAPSFMRRLDQKRLDDALVKVDGALREAQSEAIKRNTDCWIRISEGVDQTVTGNCLVTGDRKLSRIQIEHNRDNVDDQPGVWDITFDYKGRNKKAFQSGTLVLSIPNSSVQPRCLVISQGIGLRRTGDYEGPPVNATNCKPS